VVVHIGVALLLLVTANNSGHNVTDRTLPMVLVVPLVRTENVVEMVVKASSLSTNSFDINNNEGDK
jgi:hypothetical protein